MRILQVAPRYAPAWAFGGGVRVTYDLAREWTQQGHEVTVFTSDQLDDRQRCKVAVEVREGICIRRFPNVHQQLAGRFPFLFFWPKGLFEALQAIRGAVDVVHVTEARGPHNRWVARAAPAQGVPFVWSAYGGLAAGAGCRRLYRALHDRAFDTRAIVQRAAALVAQTTHEASIYEAFGAARSRIRQIPLAVDWSDFEERPERGCFRRELGISDGQRLVTFLGRLHQTKGLQALIPAFARVAREMPGTTLAIVGWDHGFAASARRIAERHQLGQAVRFVDARLGDSRLQVYRDSDLFVLTPGVYEETSLAALEACASGVPCVITHQCEIPGLDAAGAGMTVRYDPDAIASAIIQILGGRLQIRMGELARAFVRSSFTSAVVAAQHLALFDAVCADARRLRGSTSDDNCGARKTRLQCH